MLFVLFMFKYSLKILFLYYRRIILIFILVVDIMNGEIKKLAPINQITYPFPAIILLYTLFVILIIIFFYVQVYVVIYIFLQQNAIIRMTFTRLWHDLCMLDRWKKRKTLSKHTCPVLDWKELTKNVSHLFYYASRVRCNLPKLST